MKKLPIVIYGDGEQVRDMLYVEDAVRAYDAFVCSDVDHGIWNLGGGIENTLTLHEHLDYLEKITGLRSPVTYQDWRPLDQKCYISDITKVKSDLKWNPLLSPKEGLYDTAEWVHGNLDIF
jgi:CDP-paratose 2-epimerase